MQRFSLILFLSIIALSCNKDRDLIPAVYVNFSINLSDAQFNHLQAVGNAEYVTGGVKGIIIYKESNDHFLAYDRACSFRPSLECERVSLDSETNGVLMVDSCCGSKFLLSDGMPIQGSALLPLKQYNTYFDGNNLQVFN